MPRTPRIEFAGAIYHVMSRGDRLEPIFRDEKDCQRLLQTLAETCQGSGWWVVGAWFRIYEQSLSSSR